MTGSQSTLEALKINVGKTYGPSKTVEITQEMINKFSEATLDPDPMHIDPEWSKEKGPYDSTISFGFLTMSLLTTMIHDLIPYEREDRIGSDVFPLNYGFNKMRLITPVPVNSKVSLTVKILDVEERKPGQYLQTFGVTMNIEGFETPAIVGEWLSLLVVGEDKRKAQ